MNNRFTVYSLLLPVKKGWFQSVDITLEVGIAF